MQKKLISMANVLMVSSVLTLSGCLFDEHDHDDHDHGDHLEPTGLVLVQGSDSVFLTNAWEHEGHSHAERSDTLRISLKDGISEWKVVVLGEDEVISPEAEHVLAFADTSALAAKASLSLDGWTLKVDPKAEGDVSFKLQINHGEHADFVVNKATVLQIQP